jgi:hypothetical protein
MLARPERFYLKTVVMLLTLAASRRAKKTLLRKRILLSQVQGAQHKIFSARSAPCVFTPNGIGIAASLHNDYTIVSILPSPLCYTYTVISRFN